eukprot:scaffold200551_cov21-Tisochrysis_lutea.AAC.1
MASIKRRVWFASSSLHRVHVCGSPSHPLFILQTLDSRPFARDNAKLCPGWGGEVMQDLRAMNSRRQSSSVCRGTKSAASPASSHNQMILCVTQSVPLHHM